MKEELKKALETLDFWSTCFDYKNFKSKTPLYGGQQGCDEAAQIIEDFLEDNTMTGNEYLAELKELYELARKAENFPAATELLDRIREAEKG